MNVVQHASKPILQQFDVPAQLWRIQNGWRRTPFWDSDTQYWSNIISTLTEDRWNSLKTKSGN